MPVTATVENGNVVPVSDRNLKGGMPMGATRADRPSMHR
ncbi:hypothetical protein MULP_00995 [Mycobacterium liflandii 128FXT]|uniref:Uncharacterized protein n=1 Tax=Mycobacterium liflandii (strain 128FXT) TaxID=459424 RepID=L7V6G9_MYCL1|nr:hypothetical protein MULP_00995 [Mycobacterium liflandii 128FXT]RFZ55748.1 hypothetical protein BB170200_03769 [Mycobacterium marinum]